MGRRPSNGKRSGLNRVQVAEIKRGESSVTTKNMIRWAAELWNW